MKKYFYVHPLIYAVLPVLVLYSHNIREAWPILTLRPAIFSLLFALLSWVIIHLFLRNKHKTSAMTSVWLISFFSYGHLYLLLAKKGFFEILPIGPHLFLFSIYLIILGSFFFWLLLSKKSKEPLTAFFNVASIFILIMNLAPLLPLELKRYLALNKLHNHMISQNLKDASYTNTNIDSYPDIYYFVFDRFPNAEVSKQYFDYDQSEFINNLSSKGFYTATKSAANYPSSFQSISSALNMTHLTFMSDLVGKNYSDQTIIYKELLDNSEVSQFLINKGYKYFQLGSNWEPTKNNPLAINYNVYLDFNEFESFIYENTLLNAIMGKITNNGLFTGVKILELHQENVPYKISKLNEIILEPGPKFTFSHFLLPHPPYMFDKNCSPLEFEEVRKRSDVFGYTEQIECAIKTIEDLSDDIIENSSRPLVIIFQSDEGPYLPYEYFNEYKFLDSEDNDAYNIHSKILNSFYLSDLTTDEDYEDIGLRQKISPVNSFRIVFNHYFGTSYQLLGDTTHIFRDNSRPYVFEDITGIISN